MTVDYQKLNQIVTLIAVDVTDIVSLLEQINTSPGTWYVAIDLANAISRCQSIMITRSNPLSFGKASSIPEEFCFRDILTILPCIMLS